MNFTRTQQLGALLLLALLLVIAGCRLLPYALTFSPEDHSSRRAISGSTLVARCAGSQHASSATSVSASERLK